MRAKSVLAFAMAIGCGLVAMVGVQQALKKQNTDPDADKVTVFVATSEILPGQAVDVTMLEKKKFLKGSVPKEAVTDPAQLEKRALTVRVMAGDIIRLDKLGEEGKTGASISIPVGMRVVTVPANMTFAHSGMLKPEDRVDIMVTYKVQQPGRAGKEYSETKTFLSYIEVFATDSVRDPNAGADPSGKASILKNISLLVTPEQAQTMAMAKSIGDLAINLRNTSDKQQIEVNNLTPDQFRTQILQASVPIDDEAGHKSQPIDAEENAVLAFANDMIQKADESTKNVENATKEAWDITFFSRGDAKVETVEVDRRKDAPKPTQMIATESPTKKVINSIIDAFEQPQTEAVTLKPIQVGRPIIPDTGDKPGMGNLQARIPKSPSAPKPGAANPPSPPKPAVEKSAKLKSTTPAKTAPATSKK